MNARAVLAVTRAQWLTASSYRVGMIVSLVGTIAAVVPTLLVARALQPVMAGAISSEGHQYFGFLLLGTVTFTFLPIAINTLPSSIESSISNGTLEMVLGTPTAPAVLLSGFMGYSLLWTALRALLLLAAGALLGASFSLAHAPVASGILLLIFVAHVPVGLIAAASVLAFRTTGPLPQIVVVLSTLLGGVYYPTHVIPGWLRPFSDLFPLTYGLRALRRVLMDGATLAQVAPDLTQLMLMTVVLFAVGTLMFSLALRYAMRNGSLGNY